MPKTFKEVSQISNRTYDVAKWIVTVVSPAFITLYMTLSVLWGWALTDQIVGTIAGVTTFAGVFLGISSIRYNEQDATPSPLDQAVINNLKDDNI